MSKFHEDDTVYWNDLVDGEPKVGVVTEVITKLWEGAEWVPKLPRWLWRVFMRRCKETVYTVKCFTDGHRYSMRESQIHHNTT